MLSANLRDVPLCKMRRGFGCAMVKWRLCGGNLSRLGFGAVHSHACIIYPVPKPQCTPCPLNCPTTVESLTAKSLYFSQPCTIPYIPIFVMPPLIAQSATCMASSYIGPFSSGIMLVRLTGMGIQHDCSRFCQKAWSWHTFLFYRFLFSSLVHIFKVHFP